MKRVVGWIGIWMAVLVAAGGLASIAVADGRLGLSDSQKEQLKALASNTRDRTGRERDALGRARKDLFEVYSQYDIDEHKAKAARDKVSAAQLCLLNVHLDNEIALRDIFNADQFERFRSIMKRRVHHPEMLVLSPPEEAAFDRFPDKDTLTKLGVSADDQKKLKPNPQRIKAIRDLQRDSNALLDLYSKYTLDSDAAHKLINAIHREQTLLLMAQHRKQQAIRDVLKEDQFQKLREEVLKRMPQRGERKKDRD